MFVGRSGHEAGTRSDVTLNGPLRGSRCLMYQARPLSVSRSEVNFSPDERPASRRRSTRFARGLTRSALTGELLLYLLPGGLVLTKPDLMAGIPANSFGAGGMDGDVHLHVVVHVLRDASRVLLHSTTPRSSASPSRPPSSASTPCRQGPGQPGRGCARYAVRLAGSRSTTWRFVVAPPALEQLVTYEAGFTSSATEGFFKVNGVILT